MLDDVEGTHEIECGVSERQGIHLALHDTRAAPAKFCQRGSADVHELRVLERQPWPQARRHLELSTGGRQQRLHQRPGIESLRFDDAGTGPQQVIKASILVDKCTLAVRL